MSAMRCAAGMRQLTHRASEVDTILEMRAPRPRIHLAAAFWILSLAGCADVTCDELRAEYEEELQEIRDVCGCDFRVECDPEEESGRNAVTIQDAQGNVLVKYAAGEEEIPEQVAEHELVHAVDFCRDASADASPPGPGTDPSLSELLLEILLMEFVAFDATGPIEGAERESPAFPEPDADDAALRSAFDSLNEVLRDRLGDEQLQDAFELLDEMGLGPEEIRADNPVYQSLKKVLEERRDRVRQTIGEECLEAIFDLL